MLDQYWIWLVFIAVVLALLAFDLGILNRGGREITIARSLKLSAFYISAGLLFGVWIWVQMGPVHGMDYFTGFLVEKSLSMDNVFVMSMIFTALAIPPTMQHRVLFWGILGAIVMRALMIGLGAALVHEFAWILLVFGAFLLITGVKMLVVEEKTTRLEDGWMYRYLSTHLRLTPQLEGGSFVVVKPDASGRPVRWFTPLFLALLLVEGADLVFAVDSIPAIFAITQEPFIVYTSNIFAILGLRALYFALAAMVHRFHYLKYALAVVLIFIGAKIGLVYLGIKIPSLLSLSVTFGLLLAGVLYSLWKTRTQRT